MTILLVIICMFLSVPVLSAQEIKPLYDLPEQNVTLEKYSSSEVMIVGSDTGLYTVSSSNVATSVWNGGRVDQIVKVSYPSNTNPQKTINAWVLRTTKGIVYTEDLKTFSERNKGLSFLTIKKYDGKRTILEKQVQELKDLCVNPSNNLEMVTATKDAVYFTRDGGLTWVSLSSMSKNTSGMKSVAVATINGETVVFMTHPIYGLSYKFPNRQNAAWIDVSAGFDIMQSLTTPDEISDILPVVRKNADGTETTEIYMSQSFIPRIYKFDWANKRGTLIYKGTESAQAIDALTLIDDTLLYTKLEGFGSLNLTSLKSNGTPSKMAEWQNSFQCVPGMINTAWISKKRSGFSKDIILSELWELYPGTINTPYAQVADGKKAIYASAYQCRLQSGIDKYKRLLKERNMNSIVIDMKDDYGYLRYDTKDPLVKQKCSITQYKIDLDHFVEEFKKDNVYLVARIVTFKDKSLTQYNNGAYAIWDSALNKPWVGTKKPEKVTDANGNVTTKTYYYDENWVDPYCHEVWEYNVAVAKELIERGFDEIQFDYIRFPTDGTNMRNAKYRWQDAGMDKESALISFLSYARENIKAPIGIDIYGANGWYRSGTRTGQDAEMLAEYVDVIGPMFYPSHFEQSFLNHAPYEDRTYRIYYYGSFRNTVLCRNRAIVRPWIQCFYLNVSYDRTYYDSNYIKKELLGTRDALDRGYMCWNNSGDYSKTPADPKPTEKCTTSKEGANAGTPAFGTKQRNIITPTAVDVSILDSILKQSEKKKYDESNEYTPFLQTPLVNVPRN